MRSTLTPDVLTLDALNSLSQAQFVAALGGIYEDSPWVAERVQAARPFSSRDALQAAMREIVDAAGREAHLTLLRAHPELARRIRMSADSVREQAGAGLDRLTSDEFDAFSFLNAAYRDRFSFPFIIAVAGKDKNQILASLQERLNHAPETEFAEALEQVHRIAGVRLAAVVREA